MALSQSGKEYGSSRWFRLYKVIDDGQTAATGSPAYIDARRAKGISVIVATGAGVSNGTVLLEGAPESDYSGTWVSLGSVTTNAASSILDAGYDNEASPIPYVRARISVGLTGGTADVYVALIA